MPTATGHGSMSSGVKEDAVSCDGDAGGDDVLPDRNGPAGCIGRQCDAKRSPDPAAIPRDRDNDERRIDQAGGAKVNPAVDQIERAVEEMRPRHQDHARTDRDQAQRGAESMRPRARRPSRRERRAERLKKRFALNFAKPATQDGAGWPRSRKSAPQRTKCSTPKITANATAPAPAASAKSAVDAGGAAQFLQSSASCSSGARRPASISSMIRIVDGDAIHVHAGRIGRHRANESAALVLGREDCSSPQRGMT